MLKEERAQASIEYLLLTAVGVTFVVISAIVAQKLYEYVNWARNKVVSERDALISML
jgi:uncharacterized protein (UPF0333 family)